MENLKLSDLIAQLTGQQSHIYPKPKYAFKSFAILVPENFKWRDCLEETWEWYDLTSNVNVGEFCLETLILHGHPFTGYCRNDHFCHVYGYKPTEDLNPKFINAFYKKWSYFNVSDPVPDSKPVQSELDLSL